MITHQKNAQTKATLHALFVRNVAKRMIHRHF